MFYNVNIRGEPGLVNHGLKEAGYTIRLVIVPHYNLGKMRFVRILVKDFGFLTSYPLTL